MTTIFKTVSGVVLSTSLLLGTSTAFAGQGEPQQMPVQQQMMQKQQAMKIDKKTMDKFVAANKKIRKIQQDAQAKMMKAIKSEGLTLKQYQQVVAQVESNPELRKKLQAQMK